MKEIISSFVVSGGVGFFNLYLAQETDFLYFGKYNKEERIAWLSIYTVVNIIIIAIWLNLVEKLHNHILWFAIGAFISLLVSFLITFLLPKVVNDTIAGIRKISKKSDRAYLPPINSFFQDIKDFRIYSFDFEGNLINSGKIIQGTEERQIDLSMLTIPTSIGEKTTYDEFIEISSDEAQKGNLIMLEFTDYTNKVHLVKIKEINSN